MSRINLVYINDLIPNMGEPMGYNNFHDTYHLHINCVDFIPLSTHGKNDIVQQKFKINDQFNQTCLEEIFNMKKVYKETH